MGQLSQSQDLGAGLKSRHVTMLSIAGVIGASLFVGSSVAIAEAGPAVLLAYLFAGLLVVMIMRMLAEMAVATPDTGSFPPTPTKPSAAGRGIPSAGCTGGSGYWLFRWKPISRRLFCIRGCRASRCGCSPWSSLSPSPAVTC